MHGGGVAFERFDKSLRNFAIQLSGSPAVDLKTRLPTVHPAQPGARKSGRSESSAAGPSCRGGCREHSRELLAQSEGRLGALNEFAPQMTHAEEIHTVGGVNMLRKLGDVAGVSSKPLP